MKARTVVFILLGLTVAAGGGLGAIKTHFGSLAAVGALTRTAATHLGMKEGATGNRGIAEVRRNVRPVLSAALEEQGLAMGAPIFIRIFKEESLLEVWLRDGETFRKFRDYPICYFSGGLGPKLKEGDRQSPEGFYSVTADAMNPHSTYHLSFNLGFPNAYDPDHGRTGSFLMVHGGCLSIGCYAMTDRQIEDIYMLVEEAHKGGQTSVPVHAFPFRMTGENMERHADSEWIQYWENLREGHDLFEETRIPPHIGIVKKRYTFN